MLKQFKYRDITWLDLESPTAQEVASLGSEYGIHPVILSELTNTSSRAKVDVYQEMIYLILHFPICQMCHSVTGASKEKDEVDGSQEIDFVIGKDFIITTHYGLVNPLNDFGKIFETDLALKRNNGTLHAGFIFYYMVKEMYGSIALELDFINERLKQVEKKVFSGKELEVVKTLSDINRALLDFRWTLKTHREILASLEIAGVELFGSKFQYYLKAISGECEKVWNMIESNRATFIDLRETGESLLSIKSNQIMKTLTVTAFIFLPLTIISQLFSMNTWLPFVGQGSDFAIVVTLMAISSALLYLVARLRRWI